VTAAGEAALERMLDQVAARKEIASAVMGVASGDGTVRWLGARGEAAPGGLPMTPETPWFVASITKLFIATLVLRLVEEGRVRLDDPLTRHLPESVTRGLHRVGEVDRTEQITVEHLLAHASGLPDFIEDFPVPGSADRRSLVQLLVADGDRSWTLEDTARRVREELRPHFPPQDLAASRVRIRYSDTNYQLLIGIIESGFGHPFAEALARQILDPLEMPHTWIPGSPRPGIPEAPPAVILAGEQVVDFPRFFASIGDLNSTASDLLRFLPALVRGRIFRDPESWRRMQARWNRFRFPTDRGALRQPGWPIQYGLGVMRFQLPRLFSPVRPMPQVVGHSGSTGTWLFHAPALDVYLVGGVSQITAGPLPYRLLPRILRTLEDHADD